MELGDKGTKLIKHFEKCKLAAYQDSKGIWTIGWGNTIYENDLPVKKGDTITQVNADKLFASITKGFVADVNKLTKGVVLKQQQFDSLVSFAYNVGSDLNNNGIAEGLGDSTLLKLVKLNPKDPTIVSEFLKWNVAGGKVLDGLTRRRKAEAYLYLAGELEFFE
ncbi:lysozyme [Chitinophaga sp. CF118]|uniref:lysozyme n=1 Tax=Chitinophaga sp. CF118 TaxID=1884367 RepID=UPI0008E2D679|nr:lysozyme [Chitinophaga sp. CF118]SFD63836.1 lysozyme [Chitinophaga sp. CF118]